MARITSETKTHVHRRLLHSAAQLFAINGLDATNIDDVAVGAGCGKGTVYNYFASKEELFGEVVAEACRRAVGRWTALTPDGSAHERLRALAAADVAVLSEDEGFTKVLVREAMSFRPETYPLIVEHLGPYLGAVETVLREGVDRGEVRRDLPVEQLALGFVGMLTLLYVQHWGTGGAWPALDEIPDLAVTMFLDGGAHAAPSREEGSRQ